MERFNIIQSDPEKYKETIQEFWQENLPGTPLDRIDWMQNNPSGPSVWYLAFDKENTRLVGTISIMPRKMLLRGEEICAGIVGDFMVDKKYRVFGPALNLQKLVIEKMAENGFDFMYTIPNAASISIMQRVGYSRKKKLMSFVKPLHNQKYVEKYLHGGMTWLIGAATDLVLKLISKETYRQTHGIFQEVKKIDESFNELWRKITKQDKRLIGDFSAEYINWKYGDNPEGNFRILTYRKNQESKLSGCIVFSSVNEKMTIFNIFSINKRCWNSLLAYLIKMARKEKFQAIYIRLSENDPRMHAIRKYLFFNAKDEIELYSFGIDEAVLTAWDYSEGDRNL